MELEATILERLEELRRWQAEQQERLLREQQEQRQLLSLEQDRMFQALGLSVQNMILDDSVAEGKSLSFEGGVPCNGSPKSDARQHEPKLEECAKRMILHDGGTTNRGETQPEMQLNVPQIQLSTNRYLNYKSPIDGFSPRSEIPADRPFRTPEKIRERFGDLEMEGVEPLPLDQPSSKFVGLDDLPVPSPKKDFTTLLEERLRDCDENSDLIENEKNPKICVKRPFLRKGEGLARFRPNPDLIASNRRGRPRSKSLSASMRLSSSSSAKSTCTSNPRLKETPKSSRQISSANKTLTVPAIAQTKLNLKNVPPPKTKVRSKSMSAATKPRVKSLPIDLNVSSDIETKNLRESEEMRIFELLEEKAENSSFCSNSSTVLALFRQSTPVKGGNESQKMRRGKSETPSMRHEKPGSDASLEEIVRSTRSNMLPPGSPVAKIRETVIQEDYVISQWETGTRNDRNIDNANSLTNRTIAAGTYKTTKHTTIQFNNNNNNINNNNINVNESMENCGSNGDSRHDDDGNSKNYNAADRDTGDKRTADESTVEKEAANVSLHVRFSEYNEYKTIDLTDASFMSNESSQRARGEYSEDIKAWSDQSSTSPESSDVEVLYSKATSRKGDTGENEELSRDEETTDQTTDNEDEDYTSNGTNDEESCDEGNTTITETNGESKRASLDDNRDTENCNESGSTIVRDDDDDLKTIIQAKPHLNDTIFKSELLKTRLAELEREIEIFRRENAAIAVQRKKLQDETRRLHREHKIREENFEREKRSSEEALQEERKRLAREKAALENRLRDAREKSLKDKQERQEITTLREQLDELREDSCQKESRWQAAQARQKSQMRVLQTENARLKQELDKLRTARSSVTRNRKQSTVTNTRSIHQISKHLENKRKSSARKDSSSDEDKPVQATEYKNCEQDNLLLDVDDEDTYEDADDGSTDVNRGEPDQSPKVKSDDDLRRKRSLYANLLSEATEGLRGTEAIRLGKHEKSIDQSRRDSLDRNRENGSNDIRLDSNDRLRWDESRNSNEKTIQKSPSPSSQSVEKVTKNRENQSPLGQSKSEARRWSDGLISQNDRIGQSTIKQQEVREVKCPDGHLEYWYPNGNVKKIYPDRNVVKMIYYNGDVRESLEDGSVKYFYASTRTWHTTLPDGLEILEFPDGQVERRTKDGTNEVSFPDGSVRLLQADGTEKWILPDGTVAETFPDGNKILSFPNGQREVHTKEHKRREYPDGTVKLVYPDGTQETRYSTGRVRVKDKDGNLLVDVHHS